MQILFLLFTVFLLFSGCSSAEKFSAQNGEIKVVSTSQTSEKKGWAIICGEKGFFPFHLYSEEIFFFDKTGKDISSFIAIEKISPRKDLVEFSVSNFQGELFQENLFTKTQDQLLSAEKISFPEIGQKKLDGSFFVFPKKFSKGDSGKGLFHENGECRGVFVGKIDENAVFSSVF